MRQNRVLLIASLFLCLTTSWADSIETTTQGSTACEEPGLTTPLPAQSESTTSLPETSTQNQSSTVSEDLNQLGLTTPLPNESDSTTAVSNTTESTSTETSEESQVYHSGSGCIIRSYLRRYLNCRNTTLEEGLKNKTNLEGISKLEMDASPMMVKLTKEDLAKLPNLKTIEITDSALREIEPDAFSNLTKLKEFTIRNCPLQHIPPNLFSNTNITDVTLYNISVTNAELQNRAFIESTTLRRIKLKVGMNEFHSKLFEKLPGMTSFTLWGDKRSIVHLSPDLFAKTNLTNLDLTNICLDSKGDEPLLISETLTTISLENVEIKNISHETFSSLPKLKYIHISNNESTELDLDPTAFEKTNVTTLKLTNFTLTSNEGPLLVSNTLTELILENSQIKNLYNTSFSRLPKMNQLVLIENKFHGIQSPSDIYKNTNITRINLINVDFLTRNDGSHFIYSEKLKIFTAIDMEIYEIAPEIFQSFPNLESLRLSRTNQTDISLPANALENSKVNSLWLQNYVVEIPENQPILTSQIFKELILQKANITKIYRETFAGLPKLERLYISMNSIVSLPAGTFENNPKLTTLDISQNKFKTFDLNGIFSMDMKIRRVSINIERNEWVCDCALYPFMQYILRRAGLGDDNSCHEPADKYDSWLFASTDLRAQCIAKNIR